ncbi:MAG: GspH/FimT family pseudopilin [Proteobacteria bacterium]|nr:GspH/FimT family pseudopilin [Pseudomonadota bacterium]
MRSPPALVPARTARGFTLLELIMVIVLIAVAVSLVAGLLGVGRQGRQLRAAVQDVATELKYARTRALVSGQSQVFAMDVGDGAWNAADHHGKLPKDVQVTFDAVREEQTSAREAAIRFFPDGSSTGGRISLRTRGVGWRVDVRWLTGEVSADRLPDARP